jgi:hypothetical protein
LVSSWRRLSFRVRTLRPVPMGLTDGTRRSPHPVSPARINQFTLGGRRPLRDAVETSAFFTIRDGMQGMESAPRTPWTDAARNALVSSWRRLSRCVRRCSVMILSVAASEE